MRGFAASQANASPKDGLTATLKVSTRCAAGSRSAIDEISAARQADQAGRRRRAHHRRLRCQAARLRRLAGGQGRAHVDGRHARMGWPTANDIHALRDLGYVDEKLIAPAAEIRRTEAMFKRGFSERDIPGHDSGGSPADHQYQRMKEKYTEITDHLNDIEFVGARTGTPRRCRRSAGPPSSACTARCRRTCSTRSSGNTRLIAMEVTQGRRARQSPHPRAVAGCRARRWRRFVRRLVDDDRRRVLDPGSGDPLLPRRLGAGTEHDHDLPRRRRARRDQRAPPRARTLPSTRGSCRHRGRRRAQRPSRRPRSSSPPPTSRTHAQKQRFFERVSELADEKGWANDFDGYVSYEDVMGEPSIMIRSGRPAQTGQDVAKFATRYKAHHPQGRARHRRRRHARPPQRRPTDRRSAWPGVPTTTFAAKARRVLTDDLEDPLERRIRTALTDRISLYEDALPQEPRATPRAARRSRSPRLRSRARPST